MPTVTEDVKSLLGAAPEPMPYDKIVSDPRFGKVTREYVSSVLSNLVKKGELRRVKWGVYAVPPTEVHKSDKVPAPGPSQKTAKTNSFAHIIDRLDEALLELSAGMLVRELKLTPKMAWTVLMELGNARQNFKESVETPDGFRAMCYLLAGVAMSKHNLDAQNRSTS